MLEHPGEQGRLLDVTALPVRVGGVELAVGEHGDICSGLYGGGDTDDVPVDAGEHVANLGLGRVSFRGLAYSPEDEVG